MDKVTRQCPQTTTFLKRKESRSNNECISAFVFHLLTTEKDHSGQISSDIFSAKFLFYPSSLEIV